MNHQPIDTAPPDAATQADVSALIDAILSMRRKRDSLFGSDLFGDQAWDILLILFATSNRGLGLSLDTLTSKLSGSPEVTKRWLLVLIERGYASASPSIPTVYQLTEAGKRKMRIMHSSF